MQQVRETVRVEQLLRRVGAAPVGDPNREVPARTEKAPPLEAQQHDHCEQHEGRGDAQDHYPAILSQSHSKQDYTIIRNPDNPLVVTGEQVYLRESELNDTKAGNRTGDIVTRPRLIVASERLGTVDPFPTDKFLQHFSACPAIQGFRHK